jgi:hypothetical protein
LAPRNTAGEPTGFVQKNVDIKAATDRVMTTRIAMMSVPSQKLL